MTQTTTPHIHVELYSKAAVVTFTDAYLIDDIVIDAVGRALFALVERQKYARIVLNFSQVQFFSSAMLVKLFRLRDMMGGDRGGLTLCEINPDLQRLFKLYPKHSFPIYATEKEALDSF